MNMLFYLSVFLFIGLCLLLSFIISIQESKSMGLGASFGGDASSSMFGASTADILKTVTKWLAVLFFVSCIFLSYFAMGLSEAPIITPTVIEG